MVNIPISVKIKARWRRTVARNCHCEVKDDKLVKQCALHKDNYYRDKATINRLGFERYIRETLIHEEHGIGNDDLSTHP